MGISKELLQFLEELKENNKRDWFNERKATFKIHENEVKAFFQDVQESLDRTDNIEGHRVYRIYRDVRFAKDKTPFNPRFAVSFKRATAALRGGYFLNIQPGRSAAGGGFYGPNAADLKRIRKEFAFNDAEIREILNKKAFKTAFGGIQGAELKTAPRDFDVNHKAIDLIRKKQFFVMRNFSDEEVLQDDFAKKVNETFIILRPYFDYMSSILTTNLNGESLL